MPPMVNDPCGGWTGLHKFIRGSQISHKEVVNNDHFWFPSLLKLKHLLPVHSPSLPWVGKDSGTQLYFFLKLSELCFDYSYTILEFCVWEIWRLGKSDLEIVVTAIKTFKK